MTSQHELHFERLLDLYGLPQCEREYRFCERRWRFDFAWPAQMVAVEIDGGQWQARGGRHARDADREKLNTAVWIGWRVLHLSGEMIADDPERWLGMLGEMVGR